jgi:hypothetical protein
MEEGEARRAYPWASVATAGGHGARDALVEVELLNPLQISSSSSRTSATMQWRRLGFVGGAGGSGSG